MTPTAADLLESAKALSRQERAELAQELLRTLGARDLDDAVRLEALRAAVSPGTASLDAGQGIRIPAGGLRDYLRERGRIATQSANIKTA